MTFMNSDWFNSVPNVVASEPGFLFTTNTWVAVGSAVIALSALGLAIYEGYQNRKHNRLSVRPALNINRFQKDRTVYAVLVNGGLGPAKITKLEASEIDSKGKRNPNFLSASKAQDGDESGELIVCDGGVHLLIQGEEVSLLQIKFPLSVPHDRAIEIITNIRREIHYEDIYGHSFRL